MQSADSVDIVTQAIQDVRSQQVAPTLPIEMSRETINEVQGSAKPRIEHRHGQLVTWYPRQQRWIRNYEIEALVGGDALAE
jgi:hypothetical protein